MTGQSAQRPIKHPARRREAEMPSVGPLDSLLRISSQLAGQVEIRAALRSVKAEVENILPVDHLDVCLIDDEAVWNTSYEVGIRTRWSLRRTLVEVSPVRSILLGETDFMLTGNAMEDPRYIYPGSLSQPIVRHQLRSRVNVAMKVLGRTIGALNCSSRQADIYDEATLDRVRHVADVLAPYCYSLRAAEKAKQAAILRAETHAREEGLRQGALELTRALEQERQRIGMDLHDQTLADLTRIVRDLERADGDGRPGNDAVLDRLQSCIQDLRRIIDMAVPTLLDLFGFAHALRIHLERAVGADSPVMLSVVDATGGAVDDMDKTIRIALFRIAQEAINNAARHARARRISVDVTSDAQGLTLSIVDDGIGVPEQATDARTDKVTGGLAHMRTRSRLIAADFHVSTGDGTRVDVRLPGKSKCGTGPRTVIELDCRE